MKGWIVIGEYSNDADAHIAAGMLEDNDIAVVIDSPSMATLYAAGSTWAPVRLFVPEQDARKAAELLKKHGD